MIKVFEKYIDYELVMTNFREIAFSLIENPPQTNSNLTWKDYSMVIQLAVGKDNKVQQLLALIYNDNEEGIGSIQIDFSDPKNNGRISVCYDLGNFNETISEHYQTKPLNGLKHREMIK